MEEKLDYVEDLLFKLFKKDMDSNIGEPTTFPEFKMSLDNLRSFRRIVFIQRGVITVLLMTIIGILIY